jgi:hypothetical protein
MVLSPEASSETLPERVRLAKDRAKRIDSAMGVPEDPAALPVIALPKPALIRTPTIAKLVQSKQKVVNFAGKGKPILVRKPAPKRGELDCPVQPESVSAHIESTWSVRVLVYLKLLSRVDSRMCGFHLPPALLAAFIGACLFLQTRYRHGETEGNVAYRLSMSGDSSHYQGVIASWTPLCVCTG